MPNQGTRQITRLSRVPYIWHTTKWNSNFINDLDGKIVKMKVVDLKRLRNFIVDNFLIWIFLDLKQAIYTRFSIICGERKLSIDTSEIVVQWWKRLHARGRLRVRNLTDRVVRKKYHNLWLDGDGDRRSITCNLSQDRRREVWSIFVTRLATCPRGSRTRPTASTVDAEQ